MTFKCFPPIKVICFLFWIQLVVMGNSPNQQLLDVQKWLGYSIDTQQNSYPMLDQNLQVEHLLFERNFCSNLVDDIELVYQLGDYLLLMFHNDILPRKRRLKPAASGENSPNDDERTLLFYLYNWKSGVLYSQPMEQNQLFPNATDSKIKFVTTLDLCSLHNVQLKKWNNFETNHLQKRSNVNDDNYKLSEYLNKDNLMQDSIADIRTILKDSMTKDHEHIKNQLKSFDLKLKILNEKFVNKWLVESKNEPETALPSTTTTTTESIVEPTIATTESTRFDNDFPSNLLANHHQTDTKKLFLIPQFRNNEESRQLNDESTCPKVVLATFCHKSWTLENQVCNENGKPCWHQTRFYMYLDSTDDHHERKNVPVPELVEIPMTYKLMLNFLPYRGLYASSFDGQFIQVDHNMRCNMKEPGVVHPRLNVITPTKSLFSGFAIENVNLAQSDIGLVDNLNARSKMRMGEFLNCHHNSSVLRKPLKIQSIVSTANDNQNSYIKSQNEEPTELENRKEEQNKAPGKLSITNKNQRDTEKEKKHSNKPRDYYDYEILAENSEDISTKTKHKPVKAKRNRLERKEHVSNRNLDDQQQVNSGKKKRSRHSKLDWVKDRSELNYENINDERDKKKSNKKTFVSIGFGLAVLVAAYMFLCSSKKSSSEDEDLNTFYDDRSKRRKNSKQISKSLLENSRHRKKSKKKKRKSGRHSSKRNFMLNIDDGDNLSTDEGSAFQIQSQQTDLSGRRRRKSSKRSRNRSGDRSLYSKSKSKRRNRKSKSNQRSNGDHSFLPSEMTEDGLSVSLEQSKTKQRWWNNGQTENTGEMEGSKSDLNTKQSVNELNGITTSVAEQSDNNDVPYQTNTAENIIVVEPGKIKDICYNQTVTERIEQMLNQSKLIAQMFKQTLASKGKQSMEKHSETVLNNQIDYKNIDCNNKNVDVDRKQITKTHSEVDSSVQHYSNTNKNPLLLSYLQRNNDLYEQNQYKLNNTNVQVNYCFTNETKSHPNTTTEQFYSKKSITFEKRLDTSVDVEESYLESMSPIEMKNSKFCFVSDNENVKFVQILHRLSKSLRKPISKYSP